MGLLERFIAPFFENANNILEAFINIIISYFGLGYVAVRSFLTIFG